MEINDLKNLIEGKKFNLNLVIFTLPKSHTTFIPYQYIKQILEDNKLCPNYIDSLPSYSDIFSSDSGTANIYRCDKFTYPNEHLKDLSIKLFIIADEVDVNTKKMYVDEIVDVPELTETQITEYLYSKLEGVDRKKLDWLLKISKYDIYRIDQEISKLNSFPIGARDSIFQQCIESGMYDTLSMYNIFNFTNALLSKDKNKLKIILSEIENCDVEPTGLITILNNNFRDLISVQLDPAASAMSLGMQPKKFAAIRYNCGKYTKDQLIEAYQLVTSLDYKLKSGELPVDKIIDYVIIHLLQ